MRSASGRLAHPTPSIESAGACFVEHSFVRCSPLLVRLAALSSDQATF